MCSSKQQSKIILPKALNQRGIKCNNTMQAKRTLPNKTRLRLVFSHLAAVLLGTVAFAAPPGGQPAAAMFGHGVSSQAAMPKPGTGNFVQRFIDELRSSGLEVSVGYPTLYTQADCAYSYPVFHNCFGNNPTSPYVMPVVKSWPEEYVDPAMKNGMGRTRPGYSPIYRLDPREAIIIFGKMPPPARYMGLQTWMWTTEWISDDSPWNENAYAFYGSMAGPLIQYLFTTVPPVNFATAPPVYGDRVLSFSSIDNNINNVVMDDKSGPPWDKIRYFVITPDQSTDAAVREVLVNLGVDEESEIFTEGIPETFQGAPVGPLGLGENAVDFFTLLRYAMPEDEQAANVWRNRLQLTVLRARRVSGMGPMPYGDHVAEARTGVDESGWKDDLEALVGAVKDRAQSQGLELDTDQEMVDLLNGLGQFGPECREIGMNCLGDNQDASYFLFKPKPLDTGRIYAVVSTLATETGNATYVGLSVNDASLLKGVLNVSDRQLMGSASGYSGQVPNTDKFFVHFFTRDCAAIANLTDGACTTITEKMVPLAGDDKAPGNPDLHGMFSAAVRAYVAVGSERGPDPQLQLAPHALTFSYE